jgi:myo-inositol-1(or 4)-monophosphatase
MTEINEVRITEILEVIKSSRAISLPLWGKVDGSNLKGDSAASVVTVIDQEVEEFFKKEFARVEPSIDFVGEEYGGNRDAERFWLIAPIDGTGHYVRGTPFCTTMVSLIEHGEVTFSAIYHFVTDEMYYAIKGGGAWRNSEKISVSNRPITESYLVFESKIHKPENMIICNKLREKSAMITMVCSGYEHCMVACGQLEARITLDGYGQDYDFAPGALLIREAGGVVTNINSDVYDYRNTNYIAANPKMFTALTVGESAIFPINKL